MKKLLFICVVLCSFSVSAQTVEDTVVNEIGHKLHFHGNKHPTNITVIGVCHSKAICDNFPQGEAQYRYINHDKSDVLPSKWDEKFKYAISVNHETGLDYGEHYKKMMADKQSEFGGEKFPELQPYNGYWIMLGKKGDKYYFDDVNTYLPVYQVLDNRIEIYDMEGLTPIFPTKISTTEDGFIYVSELYGEKRTIEFKLVDKKRSIYKIIWDDDDDYITYTTKAENQKAYEVIQYASRMGNMMDWEDQYEK